MTQRSPPIQHYPSLFDTDAHKARVRYRHAVRVARTVLNWLADQGIRAGVFGSLAQGRFKAHSDVDFLILRCPEPLRYRFEAGIEDRMEGLPFDVVYVDEINESSKSRVLQEVVYASNLC